MSFGGGDPSVHLTEVFVLQRKKTKNSKSIFSSYEITTHGILIIFDALEREMNFPETFFDLYDFGGGTLRFTLLKFGLFLCGKVRITLIDQF